MPRQARKVSGSGIYHVMLRGVNRQVIFQEDADRTKFLWMMKDAREVSGFRLHAFCLMPNHVHLLIQPVEEPLEIVFKRIGTRYAGWYNKKYGRVGHLFQDRFRSENVETDRYYMTVLRYILWNPVKAGMVPSPDRYRWSSYRAYEKGTGSLTDTGYAEALFGSREQIMDYLRESADDEAMDDEPVKPGLREERVGEIFRQVTGCDSPDAFRKLEKPRQRACVREMYYENLSVNQIVRLTGMPKSSVYYMVKDVERAVPEEATPVLREAGADMYLPEGEEIW